MKKLHKMMFKEYLLLNLYQLMKVVDTNGDGKISFEEFW